MDEERAAKRQCTKPKRNTKHRRRKGIRSAPSDVWAAIFKKLPNLEHQLPSLRLVCRQFEDAVCTRVMTTLRPRKSIRDSQMSALLGRFPILRSVDVSGCHNMTGAWMRDLEQLKTITQLRFEGCRRIFPSRDSSYWLYVSSADTLQHLSVANNPAFSDEDASLLYDLVNLRNISLRACTSLTADGLMLFGQGPEFASHLTALDLDELPNLEDACLTGISGLPRLQTLSLAYCSGISWEGIGFLAPLLHLTHLSVEGCQRVSLKGAALAVSKLTSLRSLNLGWLGGTVSEDHDIAIEAEYRSGRNHSENSFGAVLAAHTPGLRQLFLGGSNLTDMDLLTLRPLSNLTELDMTDCQELTSDGLSALRSLKDLVVLSLEGCLNLHFEGMSHLTALPQLRDLDLGACDEIDDQALGVLAAATNLSCLNLTDCSVSDEGIEELKRLIPLLSVAYTSTPDGAWNLMLNSDDSDEEGVGAAFHVWLQNEIDSDNEEDGAQGDEQQQQQAEGQQIEADGGEQQQQAAVPAEPAGEGPVGDGTVGGPI